jgi:hypothetical protein
VNGRFLVALLAAALAAAPAAGAAKKPPKVGIAPANQHPGLPYYPSGSVVGAGLPLKAFASIAPAVHLFGDTIQARVAVLLDSRLVDPSLVRVHGGFLPYEPVAAPTFARVRVGRLTQLTWTWSLRCLDVKCVPIQPSDKYHVFRFHPVHVDVVRPDGRLNYGITAGWPPIEVQSQISPAVLRTLALYNRLDWRYRLTPVATPTYARSPTLLFWLALSLAALLLTGAAGAVVRWYLMVSPRRATVAVRPGTPLERALALIAWAHARGDETLQRKAFERAADELVVLPAETVGELSRTARELAWSARLPEDDEIESFAQQALETGTQRLAGKNGHPEEADE